MLLLTHVTVLREGDTGPPLPDCAAPPNALPFEAESRAHSAPKQQFRSLESGRLCPF